ncbi:MAG: hypothetical protein ISS92_02815 [Candidatus Omnitrophica bacterium]|nr:hypothetical protein [Candidatus Omnitrophota bacterium]
MEKKRSVGIAVFAWLIIIVSALGILQSKASWDLNHIISNYLYLILLFPLSIVVAIFLLKLENWARIAIIVISVIVAAESIITIPHVLSKIDEYSMVEIEESFYKGLEAGKKYKKPDTPELTKQQVEEAIERAMQLAKKAMQAMVIIMITISTAFNCAVIYFFTRPKVKEQFE